MRYSGREVKNPYSESRASKETTSVEWLGPLEAQVLSAAMSLGFKRFKPSLIVDKILQWNNIPASKRLNLLKRIADACKRLVERGILRKLAHGLYEVAVDPIVLSKNKVAKRESYAKNHVRPAQRSIKAFFNPGVETSKERSRGLGSLVGSLVSGGLSVGSLGGSSGSLGSGLVGGVGGLVVDNVRVGGSVGGLGLVSGWGVLSLPVGYGELGVRVGVDPGVASGFGFFGVYWNRSKDPVGSLRVEWRPGRRVFRFLRVFGGVGGLRRGFVLRVGVAVLALLRAFDYVASWEEKLWLARELGGLGLGWLGLGCA